MAIDRREQRPCPKGSFRGQLRPQRWVDQINFTIFFEFDYRRLNPVGLVRMHSDPPFVGRFANWHSDECLLDPEGCCEIL